MDHWHAKLMLSSLHHEGKYWTMGSSYIYTEFNKGLTEYTLYDYTARNLTAMIKSTYQDLQQLVPRHIITQQFESVPIGPFPIYPATIEGFSLAVVLPIFRESK